MRTEDEILSDIREVSLLPVDEAVTIRLSELRLERRDALKYEADYEMRGKIHNYYLQEGGGRNPHLRKWRNRQLQNLEEGRRIERYQPPGIIELWVQADRERNR